MMFRWLRKRALLTQVETLEQEAELEDARADAVLEVGTIGYAATVDFHKGIAARLRAEARVLRSRADKLERRRPKC